MTRNRYSVAFVTGGASGIGLAITKQLLERGDCVAVCDKSHLALQENKEALQRWGISRLDVSFHQADVSSPEQLKRAFEGAIKEHGRIDILFNNAGVVSKPFAFTNELVAFDEVQRVIDIDFTAAVRVAREFIMHVKQRGGTGTLISTASNGGLYPMLGAPEYAASKAGVIALTRALASLESEGIKSIVVCPDYVDTPFIRDIKEVAANSSGLLTADFVAACTIQSAFEASGSIVRITPSRGAELVRTRIEVIRSIPVNPPASKL